MNEELNVEETVVEETQKKKSNKVGLCLGGLALAAAGIVGGVVWSKIRELKKASDEFDDLVVEDWECDKESEPALDSEDSKEN